MIVSLNNTKRLNSITEQHCVLYDLKKLKFNCHLENFILTLEYSAKVIFFSLVFQK